MLSMHIYPAGSESNAQERDPPNNLRYHISHGSSSPDRDADVHSIFVT